MALSRGNVKGIKVKHIITKNDRLYVILVLVVFFKNLISKVCFLILFTSNLCSHHDYLKNFSLKIEKIVSSLQPKDNSKRKNILINFIRSHINYNIYLIQFYKVRSHCTHCTLFRVISRRCRNSEIHVEIHVEIHQTASITYA